jgi:hypothetical protein
MSYTVRNVMESLSRHVKDMNEEARELESIAASLEGNRAASRVLMVRQQVERIMHSLQGIRSDVARFKDPEHARTR